MERHLVLLLHLCTGMSARQPTGETPARGIPQRWLSMLGVSYKTYAPCLFNCVPGYYAILFASGRVSVCLRACVCLCSELEKCRDIACTCARCRPTLWPRPDPRTGGRTRTVYRVGWQCVCVCVCVVLGGICCVCIDQHATPM